MVQSYTYHKLFHASNSFMLNAMHLAREQEFDSLKRAFEAGLYKPVHTFKLRGHGSEELEKVFRLSQNTIPGGWARGRGYRSTSVGDIVKVNRDYWVVASEGFDWLWREQPDAAD